MDSGILFIQSAHFSLPFYAILHIIFLFSFSLFDISSNLCYLNDIILYVFAC